MRIATWIRVLSMLIGASAQAADFYVSPQGSDSNPGTVDRPFGTVLKGLTSVRAGDTLFARGGTYVERIKSPSIAKGTESSPILFKAYPGERPVIQGLLWLSGPSYWTIDRINVTWDSSGSAGEHMVKMTNGVGWTVQNCEFWGAHSYAALLIAGNIAGEPSNWRVAYNQIHDTYLANATNQDHLIYCNPGLEGTGGVIERNLLWNASNGHGVKLGGSTYTTGGAANVVVRYNTIFNTSMNVMVSGTSHSNRIERNILVGTKLESDGSYKYGNVRGNSLSGTDNIARDNWCDRSKGAIDNYNGGVGVSDGGGNLWPVDPLFNHTAGAGGFYPANPEAQAYGRYAGESGGEEPGDRTPPEVSIVTPFDGSSVTAGSVLTILAQATDNVSVSRVEFYVEGSLKCVDTTAEYSCAFKLSRKKGRSYRLQAKAFDSAGNSAVSPVITVAAR